MPIFPAVLGYMRYIHGVGVPMRVIGKEIGVSRWTVSRYLREVTPLPASRAPTIRTYWGRYTVRAATEAGFGRLGARALRGVSPATFLGRTSAMRSILDELIAGATAAKGASLDIRGIKFDWAELEAKTREDFYKSARKADLSPEQLSECLG